MSRSAWRLPLLIVLAVLFFGLPSSVDVYVDWLWFGETGYQQVFLKAISTQFFVGTVVFVIAFAWLFANLRVALTVARPREFVVMTPEGPRSISVDPVKVRPVLYLVAGGAALLAGLVASSQWDTWLFFRHGTPFGQADPILGHDVGFYVFSLPFLQFAQGLMVALVVVGGIASIGIYVLAGSVGLDAREGIFFSPRAVRHLSVIAAVLLVGLAYGAWLAQAGVLVSDAGILHGAGYTDVHARLPLLKVLVVASLVAAALAAFGGVAGKTWPVLAGGALYLVVSLGSTGYAAILQRFIVAPNEQVRETPYLVHNIAATRQAFALDNVVERELSGDALLSRADLDRNAATLRNVPLWNHQPLLDTFGQIQEIRTYYDFVSVHNDRYLINGEYRQIMLSGRELNSNSLPNRTWINEHLTFTHGYGLTLGPVNQVTPEGLPVLFIRNLPPESVVDLKVDEPSLYFGEIKNDHVFVKTKTPEFHYPRGDDNVTTTYAGDGGVSIGTLTRRALFAVKFRSLKILLSDDFTEETRVLYYRRVAERVRKIAPFLTYEDDRYLSIADGRLYWIQDAYTVSSRYPYSTPAPSGINYIRNSIKAVVDAYHGTTRFYRIDANDPISTTLEKIFPGLLRPLDEMPEGLRTRLRYPQGIFQLQVGMFSTFHMTNPATFYNKEDQWEVPVLEARAGESSRMLPYYTIMKLPGEQREEFIQMLPLTPRQKDNLAAWLVARSDGENYGRLMVFAFPKQKVIFGPRQVVARINQDQVIAPQITLWNQQGSEVIQGTLLVIPIEESLIYIRPLYLRSAGGRIPELKRVIVAYQNRIVMEETLDEALERIFPATGGDRLVSGDTPTAVMTREAAREAAAGELAAGVGQQIAQPAAPPAATGETGTLAAQARETYQRALRAQREGNWAQYGEEIRRLGDILERLSREQTPPRQP